MLSGITAGSSRIFSGSDAFKLYDTYGFPIDLTRLMCEEKGLTVDEPEFEKCMDQQRLQARNAAKFRMNLGEWIVLKEGKASSFTGYNSLSAETSVIRYSKNDKNQLLLVLEQTPFYAESGGQVADRGTLIQSGQKWNVLDVYKEGDSIVHVCE
ncbi:MAG: alanine--tRNA ligase, partial [SAR324 cluster bacterium]|nr:alanine--tRNA ligase [SAR324 cluster bacterium]